MTLNPLTRSPLADQAAERLREQVTSGQWPVGARLPGENALARQLGVGRSTVREAIRALAGAGMLQTRQGAGVFVVATHPVEDWQTRLRRASVLHLFEVRGLLEVEAAGLAALRRDDDDLAALDLALAGRRDAALGDDEAFVAADVALHAAVVAAAHNPVLTDLFAAFEPALRRGLVDLVRLLPLRDDRPDPGDDAHAALVEAVRRGDAPEATRIMREEVELNLSLLRKADADG
ncbi:FadR/GntR family transcriptional regulator [Streptosporangium carneum]|uniref:GntR family transcriptional regulator n=1 Tax=Streptosporangium carneum TaxID=47481 RepID=A0A9W6MI11_9ACTN|nr:FCD domain-containing protein [Streptosporangium carneum]GLK14846.1 GntR family transcriptional regulator [Streptosporangium carneum]